HEHHAASRAPDTVAVYVEAHENPAVGQGVDRIFVFTLEASDAGKHLCCLQCMLVTAEERFDPWILDPESIEVVRCTTLHRWNADAPRLHTGQDAVDVVAKGCEPEFACGREGSPLLQKQAGIFLAPRRQSVIAGAPRTSMGAPSGVIGSLLSNN